MVPAEWLTTYSSPAASTPKALIPPSTVVPPRSAVCSTRSAATDRDASPVLELRCPEYEAGHKGGREYDRDVARKPRSLTKRQYFGENRRRALSIA
jgi:hypothetical protein